MPDHRDMDVLYKNGPWDIVRWTWGVDLHGVITMSEVHLRYEGNLVIPVNDKKFSVEEGHAGQSKWVHSLDVPEDVIARYKLLRMGCD